ncbi:MAG: tetratricopeptide repeat protein [Bryobacteraceae bacterium]|nr:tetratricopeptide repeat protein [Bryobacteraceae bacterium]
MNFITRSITTLAAAALLAAPGERSLFEKATAALQRGDLPAARAGFEAVLAADPRNLPALGNLAVVCARQADYAKAEKLYRRALALAPANPILELNLGLALFKQQRFQDAAPHFRRVLSKQPAHAQARELLVTSLIQTGRAAEALDLLAPAPADDGVLYLRGLALSRLGRHDEARRTFESLFQVTTPARARYLSGRAHAEAGAYEQALADLEEAARLDPSLEGVHRAAAKALIALRRYDEASAHLARALQRDPHDIESRYLRGAIHVQLAEWIQGRGELDRVVQERPASWGTHYYLGRAFLGERNAAAAVKALEQAAALAPDRAPVFFQLVRAYQMAGRAQDAARARERLTALRTAEANDEKTLLESQ